MLSVKHIGLAGYEAIYMAHEVEFRPSKEAATCLTRSPIEADTSGGDITLTLEDRHKMGLSGGTVFVMNDVGKTVARYDLGASMVPLDAAA